MGNNKDTKNAITKFDIFSPKRLYNFFLRDIDFKLSPKRFSNFLDEVDRDFSNIEKALLGYNIAKYYKNFEDAYKNFFFDTKTNDYIFADKFLFKNISGYLKKILEYGGFPVIFSKNPSKNDKFTEGRFWINNKNPDIFTYVDGMWYSFLSKKYYGEFIEEAKLLLDKFYHNPKIKILFGKYELYPQNMVYKLYNENKIVTISGDVFLGTLYPTEKKPYFSFRDFKEYKNATDHFKFAVLYEMLFDDNLIIKDYKTYEEFKFICQSLGKSKISFPLLVENYSMVIDYLLKVSNLDESTLYHRFLMKYYQALTNKGLFDDKVTYIPIENVKKYFSALPSEEIYIGIGNIAGHKYAVSGGARLILANDENINGVTYKKYTKFDLREEAEFQFTVNVSHQPVGTVMAFYLIPMGWQVDDIFLNSYYNEKYPNELKNALQKDMNLTDEWGLGYNDATRSSLEIDILEISSVGCSSSLHGIAKYGDEYIMENGKYKIGFPGASAGIHGFKSLGWEKPEIHEADLTIFGPGESYLINTLKPIDVKAKLYGPNSTETDKNDKVKLIVEFYQEGEFKHKYEVENDGYPPEVLKHMNLLVSYWVPHSMTSPDDVDLEANTWWLDGFNYTENPVTDIRGMGRPSSDYDDLVEILEHPNEYYLYYNKWATPVGWSIAKEDTDFAKDYMMCFMRLGNISVYVKTQLYDYNKKYYWILDAEYRGLTESLENWDGSYHDAYNIYLGYYRNKSIGELTEDYLVDLTNTEKIDECITRIYNDSMTTESDDDLPLYTKKLIHYLQYNGLPAPESYDIQNNRYHKIPQDWYNNPYPLIFNALSIKSINIKKV